MTTQRERLPNRRASENISLRCRGVDYVATVSRFPNGKPAEIFLNSNHIDSSADVAARDSAIAFSFAMQYGADSEQVRRALCRDSQGQANGPLGAVLDLITVSSAGS